MKRLLLTLTVISLATAYGFAAGPVGFGLHVTGASLNFAKPLNEIYGGGFGGGAHVDINIIPFLSLRASADYISFSPDQGKYASFFAGQLPGTAVADYNVEGGRIGFLSLAANAKFGFGTPLLSPYLTAGAGTTTMSFTDLTVKYKGNSIPASAIASETKPTVNLGAGVDFKLVVVSLFVEARYTWIFTEGEASTYIPVTLGITF